MNATDPLFLDQLEDHTVSHQKFDLRYNEAFDMLHTNPQPPIDELPMYYESEDYISHTDAKRSWFEKAYHIVKKRALKQKINLLQKYQPNKGNLLDMGCGTGDFLQQAQQAGWNIQGVEPNEKARRIAESKGATLLAGTELAADNSYDAITLWHVLEHLPNLEEQIKALKRIVKPNGTVVIAVPNYKSFDAKHYKQFWAAYDVPIHLWHFSTLSIERLFAQADMQVVAIHPMKFDSYYVSMLSEKNKTGKINIAKAFCVGLYSNVRAVFTREYSSHIYVLKNK